MSANFLLLLIVAIFAVKIDAFRQLDKELIPNQTPGKIFSWSNTSPKTDYNTKSITTDDAMNELAEKSSPFEAMVIFTGTAQPKHGAIMKDQTDLIGNSFHSAMSKQVLNYVYTEKSEKLGEVLTKRFPATHHVENEQDLKNILEKHPSLLSNGKLDVIHMPISHNKMNLDMNPKVLYVTAEESNLEKHTENPTTQRKLGQYSRILIDSSNIIDGLNYKPEGSEYSIYYKATYLYITPDLFTGIMTGLFFIFVLYLGLSCLGSIQGNMYSYENPVPVGKEA
jgi:hypothetical protein